MKYNIKSIMIIYILNIRYFFIKNSHKKYTRFVKCLTFNPD